MAGIINTGNFPRALWPGVNAWFGQSYKEWTPKWSHMFDKYKSDKNYEIDVQEVGFGAAQVKPQGGSVVYDSLTQGYESRYNHITYGLGFVVTKEELEDNLYMKLGESRSKKLARAFNLAKEYNAASIYNNAFSGSYVGGDGVSLLNTAHPRTSGGTFANKLAVDADLSEQAIEDMSILIDNTVDDRGFYVSLSMKELIVSPSNKFNSQRILNSVKQSGTANNDINVLREMGAFPDGVLVSPYININPRAWYVRTDAPDGLKYFDRVALSFDQQNDFDTTNFKAMARERYSFGWTDPRGLFGSNAP